MKMSRQESGRLGGFAKAAHAGPIVNVCKECRKKFTPRPRGNAGRAQPFCSRSCSLRWQHREGSRKGWTWQKEGLEATEHPTTLDIAWAAGVYEGEGWCSRGSTAHAAMGQMEKTDWLLKRLKALFGGGIYRSARSGRNKNYRSWNIHGARARGFLMTIYKFLSPRRQEQVRRVLEQT